MTGLGLPPPTFDVYSITEDDFRFLQHYSERKEVRSVLEFGPGTSTLAFTRAKCRVVSLESSGPWSVIARERFAAFPSVTIVDYDPWNPLPPPEVIGLRFDLAFVDGPPGTRKRSRLGALELALRLSPVVILHDANRHGERESVEYLVRSGVAEVSQFLSRGRGMVILERKGTLNA